MLIRTLKKGLNQILKLDFYYWRYWRHDLDFTAAKLFSRFNKITLWRNLLKTRFLFYHFGLTVRPTELLFCGTEGRYRNSRPNSRSNKLWYFFDWTRLKNSSKKTDQDRWNQFQVFIRGRRSLTMTFSQVAFS